MTEPAYSKEFPLGRITARHYCSGAFNPDIMTEFGTNNDGTEYALAKKTMSSLETGVKTDSTDTIFSSLEVLSTLPGDVFDRELYQRLVDTAIEFMNSRRILDFSYNEYGTESPTEKTGAVEKAPILINIVKQMATRNEFAEQCSLNFIKTLKADSQIQ